MNEQNTALSDILDRLGRVERENRRLKRIGLGGLVLAGAVLLMGQARSNRTIEAEKFVLKDTNGTIRARLEMDLGDRPTLALLDSNGFPLVSLGAGESPFLLLCNQPSSKQSWKLQKGSCEARVQLGAFSGDIFGLALYEKDKGALQGLRAALGIVKGDPALNLFGEDSTQQASLDLEQGLLLSGQEGDVVLGKANLDISDKQGFSTTIGSTELVTPRTGESHKTSAASVVLFGKDGKALWSAP